jgi:hypothetical protein
MDPITTATTALSAGGQLISLIKSAGEQAKAAGKSDVLQNLLEVQFAAMELLQKQQALIEENSGLRQQVADLQQLLNKSMELEYRYNAYWSRNAEGALDGPFSAFQWDKERKLVRLPFLHKSEEGLVMFWCQDSNRGMEVPVRFLTEHKVAASLERLREWC